MVTYDGLGMSDVRNGQTDLQRFNIDALAAIELQTLDYARLLCPVRNLAAAVVNLVSPFEQPLRSGKQPLHGTVSLRQAAFNTWNPAASLTVQPSERTQVGAAANWFYADNNYPFYVENGVASEHLRRANSRMQTAQTELHARQRWTHSQLHAAASFYHNHRRLPGPVVLYVNDNNEQLTEQQAFGQARWTWQNKAWSAFAAAKYDWQKSHYTHHNTAIAVGAPRQKYYQREVYLTAGMQRNFSHHIALAYATDYAHTALSSNLPATKRVSRDTWLQSLSASWHAGPVSLTLRGLCHLYANHRPGAEAADNEVRLTPAVSASVRAVGQRHLRVFLRAGYKEAFRMPSFTENYYHHLGSTDLKPELTRQTNLGLTAQTAYGPWQMLLTADAYYNQVEQRIVSIPYNLFVWRTVNLGEVRVGGLDLTLHTTLRVAPPSAAGAHHQLQSATRRRPFGKYGSNVWQPIALHPPPQRSSLACLGKPLAIARCPYHLGFGAVEHARTPACHLLAALQRVGLCRLPLLAAGPSPPGFAGRPCQCFQPFVRNCAALPHAAPCLQTFGRMDVLSLFLL